MRWLILALALIAFVLVTSSLRRVMPTSSDGWYFWQGSVSILEGLGYRTFDGAPIRSWPPLYSLYLAGVQAVLGVSGWSLSLSTALVTGFAVLVWGGLIRWYAVRRGDTSRFALALAWVTVLLALNARDLRAENLVRVLLPVLVFATLRGGTAASSREHLSSACIAALAMSALLATRNVTIAFVPGVAAVFALWQGGRPALRALAISIATLIPLGAWIVIRGVLGQESSHELGLGAGRDSPFFYAVQFVRGVDRSTNLDFVGLPLLMALGVGMLRADAEHSEQRTREGAATWIFVAVSSLAMIGLFSITSVSDGLRGRFTVWVPLVVGGLGIVDSRRLLTQHVAVIFFAVLFAQPALRTGKHALRGRGERTADYTVAALRRFVPVNATIKPGHVGLPPIKAGGQMLVSPPFPGRLVDQRK
jgi:hypothetical protein